MDIESPSIAVANAVKNGVPFHSATTTITTTTTTKGSKRRRPRPNQIGVVQINLCDLKDGDRVSKEFLKINIGGRSAQIPIESDCDGFFPQAGEYYFEKSPTIFDCVVDYYTTGQLHRPMDICPIRLRDDLLYWRVPHNAIAKCCDELKFARMYLTDGDDTAPSDQQQVVDGEKPLISSLAHRNLWTQKLRQQLWLFLERPTSSVAAKIWSILSATFVLLSLAGLIASSMPEYQLSSDSELMTAPDWRIQLMEACCMTFFTIEYAMRLWATSHRWQFIKEPLNIIDLLTIVPFYAELALPIFGIYGGVELRNLRGTIMVVRVMRLARVARIFKLARYSIGLRAFGETMRKSATELTMLGIFLLTGIMLFSTAIYFFERDEPNSKFYSIPAAWWWCVATMTTVGYGDLVPVTVGGKVVASMASVCGIIVLAFPISMIIDKFAESTGERAARTSSKQTSKAPDACEEVSEMGQGTSGPARPLCTRRTKRLKTRSHLF